MGLAMQPLGAQQGIREARAGNPTHAAVLAVCPQDIWQVKELNSAPGSSSIFIPDDEDRPNRKEWLLEISLLKHLVREPPAAQFCQGSSHGQARHQLFIPNFR